tara:strand:+ start:888 stop:1211 length:324 start_codon:yes stop_codon:yes gene_type:complete
LLGPLLAVGLASFLKVYVIYSFFLSTRREESEMLSKPSATRKVPWIKMGVRLLPLRGSFLCESIGRADVAKIDVFDQDAGIDQTAVQRCPIAGIKRGRFPLIRINKR